MSDIENEPMHISVLSEETVALFREIKPELIVDATLGLGGHSELLLEDLPQSRLIGIDQDEAALKIAGKRLERFGKRVSLHHSNFENLKKVIHDAGDELPDAILADIGVSSMQLDDPERGFSFRADAPLDMRMDRTSGNITAAELIAETDEEELANIIYRFGEERRSRKIAKWLKNRQREGRPVTTTGDLADLVERAVGRSRMDKTSPATRTFQALRIAVNDELGVLERFIGDSVEILRTKGILAVITFHSLEDRIVKRAFQRLSGKCECPPRLPVCQCGAVRLISPLTKKPIVPSQTEIEKNPRARSAKLRAAVKI